MSVGIEDVNDLYEFASALQVNDMELEMQTGSTLNSDEVHRIESLYGLDGKKQRLLGDGIRQLPVLPRNGYRPLCFQHY